MANTDKTQNLDQIVVRFSGDSGDGMQLAGNIFSTISATVGRNVLLTTFQPYNSLLFFCTSVFNNIILNQLLQYLAP